MRFLKYLNDVVYDRPVLLILHRVTMATILTCYLQLRSIPLGTKIHNLDLLFVDISSIVVKYNIRRKWEGIKEARCNLSWKSWILCQWISRRRCNKINLSPALQGLLKINMTRYGILYDIINNCENEMCIWNYMENSVIYQILFLIFNNIILIYM